MTWRVRGLAQHAGDVLRCWKACVRRYLRGLGSVFSKTDFWPAAHAGNAARTFAWWFAPAYIAALLFEHAPSTCKQSYLCRAAEQGISPELWNVLGCLGVALLGLAALVPSCRMVAKMANKVLANTYSIGCLSLGLVTGKASQSLTEANVIAWRDWLGGISVLALIVVLVAMNGVVWYMSFLAGDDDRPSPVLRKWSSHDVMRRMPVALVLIILPLYCLLKSR